MTAACPNPKCEQHGFANPGELAGHLVTVHAIAASAALLLARQTFTVHQPSADSSTQPREQAPTITCRQCGKPGHRKDSPEFHPKAGTESRRASTPTIPRGGAKKRKAITRRHPKPPAKAATNGLVSEISALGAVAAALEPLDFSSRANVLGCICKRLAIDPSKLAA